MTEVEQFKKYMLNHGKSEVTVKNTIPDIKEFLSIMEIDSIEKLNGLRPLDIEDYLSDIRERGLSENSRKTKVARVRMFFNFLFSNGLIDKNIMVGQKVKCGIPEIVEFTHAEVVRVLNQSENIREYTILHTLMGTGVRVSELVNLRCDKVFNDSRIQVLGKGNKWRTVECPQEVVTVLQNYINVTEKFRGSSPYVFMTRNGNPIGRLEINRILKNMASRAKIDNWEKFSAHKVRHMYGEYGLNTLKLSLDVISKNLGHSSVAITSQIYAKTNKERIKEQISGINETSFFGRKEHYFDVQGTSIK